MLRCQFEDGISGNLITTAQAGYGELDGSGLSKLPRMFDLLQASKQSATVRPTFGGCP